MNSKSLLEKQLEIAENALRDINERVEHSGSNLKCRDEVSKLCNRYWSNKSKIVGEQLGADKSCGICKNRKGNNRFKIILDLF